MKPHWKIPIVCLQLLLVLGLLLGTQTTVKADQFDEGLDAYYAGNYQKALELYKSLAERGDARAQFSLGLLYRNGKGVPQDYAEAVKWIRKAAEQGFGPAQTDLGFVYAEGKEVPQNYTEAVKWTRKAAEHGNAFAQNNLGVSYDKGQGVPQDYTEALKWYHKAAEKGLAVAQNNLGLMYDKGKGVPQDYVQAHKWLNLSASRSQGKDQESSVRNRDIVEKKMTLAQVAEAQKLAREWKPKTWKELSQQN